MYMDNVKIEEMNTNDVNEDALFKVIVVGDCAVGKSNLLSRYVSNAFSGESRTTIGVELWTKTYKVEDKVVKVNIWDTAGQERFTALTSAYYKGANGAFIVYDITRKETFENVKKWYKELKMKVNKKMYVVLVGNKSDLYLLRKVRKDEGGNLAKEMGVQFYETSALDASNVGIAFKEMIANIYMKYKHNVDNDNASIDEGKFSLNNDERDIGLRCNC